jgi:hypothetical protein
VPRLPGSRPQREREAPAAPRAGEDRDLEFCAAREAFGPLFEPLLCLAQAIGPALQRGRENAELQASAKALRSALKSAREASERHPGEKEIAALVAASESALKAAKGRAEEAGKFARQWRSNGWPKPLKRRGSGSDEPPAVASPLFFVQEALKVCPDAPRNSRAWARFAVAVGLSKPIKAGLPEDDWREAWTSLQATWGNALKRAEAKRSSSSRRVD